MNLQVGVKVFIKNSKDRFLLLRRSAAYALEAGKESWDIPGGRIGPGETTLDALKREVMEEIGVVLTGNPSLIAAQDIIKPSKSIHVIRLTYVHVQEISGIKLSNEHDGFKWTPLKEMKELDIEPFLKEVIESL